MMKNGKKAVAVLVAATVTAASLGALTACGNKSAVAGTYTVEYSTAQISGNVEMNGYLVALECTETNTLVLKDDNTYEYTKYLIQHRDTSMYQSLAASARMAAPLSDEVDENVLFSWTSAGDGNCTLDFNKDGTYKFHYTTMGMTETGTWAWDNWAMTLTQSNDTVLTATIDADTHALNIHYVAVAGGGQLFHDFTCASDVWGVAFGGAGSYTPVNTRLLFAWTSAGDGNCTLEFNKDGTYKFVYTTMNMTETGTWTWDNWTMTLTQSNDTVLTATIDADTHALNIHYVAVAGGGQLYHDFTCASDVWGVAFGGAGSYTPVEGGGDDNDDNGDNDSSASGTSTTLEIRYVFTGTYTYDGDTVILEPATACTWKEDWGALRAAGGFIDCSGTEKDTIMRNKAYDTNQPLNYFGGIYFYSSGNTQVKVKLNGNTFEYIEESVFD